MIKCNTIVLSAALLAVAPAAAASPLEDLERANAHWIATINSGDLQSAFAQMTDDAAIISATGPMVIGRLEVAGRIEEISRLSGFHIEFILTRASVSNDGNSGIVVGDSVFSFVGPDGKPISTKQRLLTVWRKERSGEWRCYLDIVMSGQ